MQPPPLPSCSRGVTQLQRYKNNKITKCISKQIYSFFSDEYSWFTIQPTRWYQSQQRSEHCCVHRMGAYGRKGR